MRFVAAILLFALPLCPAQTKQQRRPAAKKSQPAPAPGPPVIQAIEVTGTNVYKPEQVIEVSGMKIGSPATREVFEAARDKVLATGCFESFGWKYEPLPGGQGFKATLEITEVAQFYPWALERLPALQAAEFSARAQKEIPLFGERIPASEVYMNRAAALIQRMLAERGVTEKVMARVQLIGKDTIAILFGPSTPPPNVAEVRFEGARVINPQYLVKALSDVAIGTSYLEPNFRMLLENQIRPMYDTVGRLRAAFTKLEVVPSAKVKGVVVTIHVEEGEPYTLGKVELSGLPINKADADDIGAWGIDKQVNFSEIGRGIEKIRDRCREDGYMKIAYKARRVLNDDKKTVDIFVDFDPGPQYKLGRLLIQGLDLETEPVIRKLFTMKPGDPYRQSYADRFLAEIRDRGIFDNLGETKSKIEVNDARQTVDLTLIFSGEKRPPKKGLP
jgi:outer membrane protein assembly factor BamA